MIVSSVVRFDKLSDSVGGIDTFVHGGDQGHAHMVLARIDAIGFAGKVATWQDGHVLPVIQLAGKFRIRTGRLCPQVEAGLGLPHCQLPVEDTQHRGKLFLVGAAAFLHMFFILPGHDAGGLVVGRHGAAVIGAVAQELPENFPVAGDEARAQSGCVGTLGQAVEDHAA